MKSGVVKFLAGFLSVACSWGMSGICFAENATQVVLQVSYPSGKDYVCFYSGAVTIIDNTKTDYYINVHVTLLDVNGNPATAGPSGEALSGVTATLSTELGSATSIVEDEFLSDSAELTFDVTDVGPAARGHVKYACTTDCKPGTDTLEVIVGSLTATAEVEVKAPPAASLVLRTLRTPGAGPVDLFETPIGQQKNAKIPALAGNQVYFEVWAIEENNTFTFAPELEGQEVMVTAHADYNSNGKINKTVPEESIACATAVATFSNGKATGYITIEAAGTRSSNDTDLGSQYLTVVLTAQAGSVTTTSLPTTPIPRGDSSLDWVAMKPRIKKKLVIGKTLYESNLTQEVDTWYVLDDNSSGPTTTDIKVFATDEYGNPVTGETVNIKSAISGPLKDAGYTLVDMNGQNGGSGDAWDITAGIAHNNKQGLATVKYLCNSVANSATANNR